MSINIREATPEDLPTLLTFEQGIITTERPYDTTLKADPISYYDLGAMIVSNDAYVIVAEDAGKLIGSGYAKRKQSLAYVESDYHAYLGCMFVDPDHRGKGVNKLILDGLLNWAKQNNLPEIHLKVYPDNELAIRAYKKAGFQPYMTEMRMGLDEIEDS